MMEKLEIENMIYNIRNLEVMLDSDLAILYDCKNGTKEINQAVKRNLEKFPNDFYFQLTKEEYNNLKDKKLSRSQFVTLNKSTNSPRFQNEILNKSGNNRGLNLKYLPFVFTEEGVAMLSSVLKTHNANIISVSIMRAFVKLRHSKINGLVERDTILNLSNKIEKHDIKLIDHENKFEELFSMFKIKEEKELVYFDGQPYDAYSKILDILKRANKELIIIDSYADKTVLDMISKLRVNTTLIIKEKGNLNHLDISKYNEEYYNLNIIKTNNFHDRYIIIDNLEIYHLGASINHAGNKTFCINKLEDKEVMDSILNKIKSYN